MYLHSFLWGVVVTLLVITGALMIAEAVLKRKIRDMDQDNKEETVTDLHRF